jgi:DNA-binding MarR family transcriptional regulator
LNRDIKYLLLQKFYLIEKLSLEEAEKAGLKYRNMVFGSRIFTLLQDNRLSISELSRVIGISRQAVHKSVKIMIEDGIVETVLTPENQKIKVVQLTEFGKTILEQRNGVMSRVEDTISEKIGSENFRILKEVLDSDWNL